MTQKEADHLTDRLTEELSEAMEAIEEEFELSQVDLGEIVPKIVIDLGEGSFQFSTNIEG